MWVVAMRCKYSFFCHVVLLVYLVKMLEMWIVI